MGCKGSSVRITPSRPKNPRKSSHLAVAGFFYGQLFCFRSKVFVSGDRLVTVCAWLAFESLVVFCVRSGLVKGSFRMCSSDKWRSCRQDPILERMSDLVSIHRKDKADKFWSYKLRRGSRAELAFDPSTTTLLRVRCDRMPPAIDGVGDLKRIAGCNYSTALDRVFSGGMHMPKFQFSVASETGLVRLIELLGADRLTSSSC